MILRNHREREYKIYCDVYFVGLSLSWSRYTKYSSLKQETIIFLAAFLQPLLQVARHKNNRWFVCELFSASYIFSFLDSRQGQSTKSFYIGKNWAASRNFMRDKFLFWSLKVPNCLSLYYLNKTSCSWSWIIDTTYSINPNVKGQSWIKYDILCSHPTHSAVPLHRVLVWNLGRK